MGVGEGQATGGQFVQVRRGDLAFRVVGLEVAIAHGVGQNEHNIRLPGIGVKYGDCSYPKQGEEKVNASNAFHGKSYFKREDVFHCFGVALSRYAFNFFTD